MLGIIGLLLGFGFVIVAIYKGWSLPIVMILGSIIVVLFNGIPLTDAFATMLEGLGTMCRIYAPIYLFSCILATLYINSGAGISMSQGLLGLFGKNRSPKSQRRIAVIVILLVGALICWSVAICLMAITNIPRKYVVAFAMSASTIAVSLPGHMSLNNLFDNFIAGDRLSAFWPGLIGGIFVFVGSVVIICRDIERDVAKGAVFDYGPLKPEEGSENAPKPLPILGAIPLILMITLYLVFGIDAWIVLALGAIVAYILFAKSLCQRTGKNVVETLKATLNEGVQMAGMPIVMIFNSTFGYAVGMTSAVSSIATGFLSLPGHPLIAYALMSTVTIGLANSSAGVVTCCLIAQEYFANLIDPGALRLITISASTILDSLPTNLCIVAVAAWGGLTVKESYPTVFKTTVVVTTLKMVLMIALLILFPGLSASL